MSEIVLKGPFASQLQREAESYGLAVEQLIEAALKHYRFQAQREKINTESSWWGARAPEVRARYSGEYVAVHGREVIDHDKNEETLRKRVRAHYGKTAVLIAPAEGQREFRIVTTRQLPP